MDFLGFFSWDFKFVCSIKSFDQSNFLEKIALVERFYTTKTNIT